MLSLTLLAARSRLLRAPVTFRTTSAAYCCIGGNGSSISNRYELKSRVFSSIGGPKDDENDVEDAEEQSINKELSPLERLMQHSQQFELEMDEMETEEEPQETQTQHYEEDQDEPFADDWYFDEDKKSSDRSAANVKRTLFRRRGISNRQSKMGKMAATRLAGKDMDEVNYDAELENVWGAEEIKLRKFHRALRREEDRDHVCTNCGEPGHRSRNCLVPRICPNCGGLGHAAHQCKYRGAPKDIDEFLKKEEHYQEKRKQSWKLRKKAARAAKNPDMPRLEEVPMSDYNKRNESLRKELDAELEAYADVLEERARKRKELKVQKEAENEDLTSGN